MKTILIILLMQNQLETQFYCTCIGRNAGMFILPNQTHVVVIGDFKQSECRYYHSYEIDIREDWTYFKTPDGKILKKYIDGWKNELPKINSPFLTWFAFVALAWRRIFSHACLCDQRRCYALGAEHRLKGEPRYSARTRFAPCAVTDLGLAKAGIKPQSLTTENKDN